MSEEYQNLFKGQPLSYFYFMDADENAIALVKLTKLYLDVAIVLFFFFIGLVITPDETDED